MRGGREMFFKPKPEQRLRDLDEVPPASAGSPEPYLLANGGDLTLLYHLEPSAGWKNDSPVSTASAQGDELIGIVRFSRTLAHFFGPPNDEALEGHSLYKIGLKPYAVAEVENSRWIAALRDRNRVHPRHRDTHYASCRHFIFTFHDNTLELIADDFVAEVVEAKTGIAAAAAELAARGRC